MQTALPHTMHPATAYKGMSARVSRKRVVVRAVAEAEKVKSAGTPGSNGVPPAAAAAATNISQKLKYVVGKPVNPNSKDLYQATAWSVREQLVDAFEKTHDYWKTKDPKFVYYLSAEFLMGRSFTNTIYNLGLEGEYAEAVRKFGTSLEILQTQEQNASLGNGGLGRLAACFLDSFATLDLPGWGYGIRYKYGMFKQALKDGYQIELPDIWLTNGNPWEIKRPEIVFPVGFGGTTEAKKVDGKTVTTWTPAEEVTALAYDNPIPGFKTATTTNLRLWDALPKEEFDLTAFNAGDFAKAAASREAADAISAVLYPNDATPIGKELRLKQQYFFVCASIQDVLARFKAVHGNNFDLLPEKATFQMNDTHPTIAVAELMRILVDIEGLTWEKAWTITQKTLNYTNHTVMPEALEKWPVKVMTKILPRHMEIIEIIHQGWTKYLESKYAELEPEELKEKVDKLSIIQPNQWNKDEMLVNMAYLACVGAAHVNGVAAIHTEILKESVLADLYGEFPEKFQNKTNGVTPRRWLAWCNPELSALITETLGNDEWINNCGQLEGLVKYSEDPKFQAKWREVKELRKAKLAAVIKKLYGQDVDATSMFDIQIKRIHEYKRQYMNVLSIIWRYKQLKKMTPEQRKETVKRTCVIGGKAASAYDMAKRIIRLVTAVGETINNDPDTKDYLRLYFIPDYNVDLAEILIPAAELSQHISTAGTEASGTSNMKFQFNGCLIIGTLDGANIEIAEESGVQNMFVFGHEADEITKLREERKTFETDPRWKEIMADISSGKFGDKEYFKPLVDSVNDMNVGNDWFLVANDFASYLDAQAEVDKVYKDVKEWTRRSIVYTATAGKFSSDRTISEYAADIWNMVPVKVPDN